MQNLEQMISNTPNRPKSEAKGLAACVEACVACELACTACADACLGEAMVAELRRCIRLNLDCADLCAATARIVSRSFEPDLELLRTQLEVCARACATCGAECNRHAGKHEHCRVCAEFCRQCEEQCRRTIDALPRAS